MLFYAAEFNKNKNQKLLIEALALIKDEIPHMRLLLAGEGPLLEECKQLATKLGVDEMVDFLGFRKDIENLLNMSDLAVASSLREGLPVNIMEAMACGLPVVASENRGHRELVEVGINGFIVHPINSANFSEKLLELYKSQDLYLSMGLQSEKRMRRFSLDKVRSELAEIYFSYMSEDQR